MKRESTTYIKWGAMLCLLLTCFCIGMMLVRLKPITPGQIATTVVLAAATVALFAWHRNRKRNE